MNAPSPQVELRVDARVETLMGVVALAAPRLPGQGWIDHPIRRRAARRWRPLAQHDAPSLVRRLLRRGFWVDDLLRLAAVLVEEHDGEVRVRFRPEGETAPELACVRLAGALADFARRADIRSALQAATEVADEVLSALGGTDIVRSWAARCRDRLGEGPATVRIFPSPLCGAHLGYGPTTGAPGAEQAWVVFGPVWRPHRRPWQLVGFSSPKLRRLVRHELGHTHLNRYTADAAEVTAHGALFTAALHAAMRPYGYGRWDVCLNEHVLRALESERVREEAGERAQERYLRREEARGFLLIRPIVRALAETPAPLARHLPAFLRSLSRHHGNDHVPPSGTVALPAAE